MLGCRDAAVSRSYTQPFDNVTLLSPAHIPEPLPVRLRIRVMLEAVRTTLTGSARNAAGAASAPRAGGFLRRQEGAAAVEFAMVALPFFALMFAIIETALVFFAGQSLEAAAAEAGRQIMTGQVQGNATIKNADDYKTYIICPYLQGSFFDCVNGVYVSVKTYSSFQNAANGADSGPPLTADGNVDKSKLPYEPGNPGDIVVVQLYYQWPIYVSALDRLANLGNSHLLVATAVFRNEPFGQ